MNPLARLRSAYDRPGFTGKVVAVYGRFSESGGGVLEDVRIERIGFRSFLVGRVVSQETWQAERWSNVAGWIAVDDISKMLVFDDVGALRQAFDSEGTWQEPSEA